MSEGEHQEGKQDEVVAAGSHQRRRRKHSHRHQGWEYRQKNTKTIRMLIFMALFTIVIILVWYSLVSRPPQ